MITGSAFADVDPETEVPPWSFAALDDVGPELGSDLLPDDGVGDDGVPDG